MWQSNSAPATEGSRCDDLMAAKWRGGTGDEFVSYYWPEAEPPNTNRGTLRKMPTVRRQPLPPMVQEDHAYHTRFKRMI